jgi:hypothetical protein
MKRILAAIATAAAAAVFISSCHQVTAVPPVGAMTRAPDRDRVIVYIEWTADIDQIGAACDVASLYGCAKSQELAARGLEVHGLRAEAQRLQRCRAPAGARPRGLPLLRRRAFEPIGGAGMALSKASWAVRLVGLKLLLFSVSLAAAAAAIAPDAAQDLATGELGRDEAAAPHPGHDGRGGLALLPAPVLGLALGRTVVCGILCALVGTPLLKALSTKYIGGRSTAPRTCLRSCWAWAASTSSPGRSAGGATSARILPAR